jgi:hypothetical protein
MQTNFADGILNIAITGPLVRIDYGTATPVTNAEGKQEVRLTRPSKWSCRWKDLSAPSRRRSNSSRS